jgi:hypothetical protein
MLGGEVREFIIELESRFPDFHVDSEKNEWLKLIELEMRDNEISFSQIISILHNLTGRTEPFSFTSHSSEKLSRGMEKMYTERIHELENDLEKRRGDCENLELYVSRLEADLSRTNHQISEVFLNVKLLSNF